jgi:hypothetical protein
MGLKEIRLEDVTELPGLGQGQVADCFERGNEHSCFIQCGGVLG